MLSRLFPLALVALGASNALAQSQIPEPPAAATVLPANVPGVLAINTTSAWSEFNRFNPFPEQIASPGGLPFFPMVGNFEQDVQPWMGEWALTSIVTDGDLYLATIADRAFTLVPVTDPDGLQTYLDLIEADRGTPSERQYQGVTLLVWEARERPQPEGEARHPGQVLPFTALAKTLDRTLHYPGWKQLFTQAVDEKEPLPEPEDPFLPEPQVQPDMEPGVAIALFPGYIAVASDAEPLEKLIEQFDPQTSLANNPEFQRILAHPQYDRAVVTAYGDFAAIADAFAAPPPSNDGAPPSPETTFIDTFQTIAEEYTSTYSLAWFDSSGMRSQGRTYYRPGARTLQGLPTASTYPIVDRQPADTYLTISSLDFAAQWERALFYYEKDPNTRKFVETIRNWTLETLKLDFDREVIGWMNDQYSFFLFPTDGGLFPSFDPNLRLGIGLAFQTGDRSTADRFLQALNDWVVQSSNGFVEVIEADVGGRSATSWESVGPDGKMASQVAFAWTEDNTLIVTTGTAPLEELLPQPSAPLGQSELFRSSIAPLPQPNFGYFFLNFESLAPILLDFTPPPDDPVEAMRWRQFVGIFRSFSGTSTVEPTFEQADLLLLMSPATNAP